MDTPLNKIIEAARGLTPCDYLLQGGHVLNVFTRRFEDVSLALYGGMIVGVGERPANKVVNMEGCYLVPGFIDGHVHLESSMLTPDRYAAAVLPRGTTGVMAEPHEYANVVGIKVFDYLQRCARELPLNISICVPPCVPATNLEHSGAELTAQDIAACGNYANVVGLAEMMNYPGLLGCVPEVLAKREALGENCHIDGHAPGLSGWDLQAYAAAGVSTDHECTTLAEAEEKLALGMYIMMREGSVAQDLEALAPLVNDINLERCLLVTDDREPEDLYFKGHMDYLCQKAIRLGVKPAHAFIMASWNVAKCFNLPKVGALAPGYMADIAVLQADDTSFKHGFTVKSVFKNGRLVAEDGHMVAEVPSIPLESMAHNTINIAPFKTEDLQIKVEEPGTYEVHVIGVKEGSLISDLLRMSLKAEEGELKSDLEQDILKVAVFERHKALGTRGLGFVHGLGIKGGAISSTVAHDSHNLVVVGDNDRDMSLCVEETKRIGGGLVVVSGGKVMASVALPICGLVADRTLEESAKSIQILHREAHKLGAKLARPFMSLAFMTLPVIPHLKLSDVGLVDVDKFAFTRLVAGRIG